MNRTKSLLFALFLTHLLSVSKSMSSLQFLFFLEIFMSFKMVEDPLLHVHSGKPHLQFLSELL